jgi:hypothetical protein
MSKRRASSDKSPEHVDIPGPESDSVSPVNMNAQSNDIYDYLDLASSASSSNVLTPQAGLPDDCVSLILSYISDDYSTTLTACFVSKVWWKFAQFQLDILDAAPYFVAKQQRERIYYTQQSFDARLRMAHHRSIHSNSTARLDVAHSILLLHKYTPDPGRQVMMRSHQSALKLVYQNSNDPIGEALQLLRMKFL